MARFHIVGAEALKAQLTGLAVAMDKERTNACMQAGMVFERYAKWYSSGHGGGPQRVSGDLNNSIETRKIAADEAQVAPATDYAGFVEYGTINMPAYPYMRPAWERGRPEAEKVLQMRLGAVVSLKGVVGAQMGTSLDTAGYGGELPEE